MPVTSLHTSEGFQCQAFDRCPAHTPSPDSIVYAQGAVFISPEYQSGTKLLVKITSGKLKPLDRLPFCIEIGYTPSFETGLEPRQWMVEILKSRSSRETLPWSHRSRYVFVLNFPSSVVEPILSSFSGMSMSVWKEPWSDSLPGQSSIAPAFHIGNVSATQLVAAMILFVSLGLARLFIANLTNLVAYSFLLFFRGTLHMLVKLCLGAIMIA